MTERHSNYSDGIRLDGAQPTHDLTPIVSPPPWTIDALCAQVDPELFFPEGKGRSSRDAKRVCAVCTVTTECLAFADAYETGQYGTNTSYATVGVYGGLSAHERALRRKRAAA